MDLDNILCVIDNHRILQQNFRFLLLFEALSEFDWSTILWNSSISLQNWKKEKKKGKKIQPKKKSLNCFKSGRNDDFRFIIWLLMVKTISTITFNAWCIFNMIFPLIFRFWSKITPVSLNCKCLLIREILYV